MLVCVHGRIRFTVVSEPPEEEEQEKECEDVGVASLRIADVLEQKQDLIETQLDSETHTQTFTRVHALLYSFLVCLCVLLQSRICRMAPWFWVSSL